MTLSAVTVKPHGNGLVQQVAGILGSPVLGGPVTLADLIGSLDFDHLFAKDELTLPPPLEVWQDNRHAHPMGDAAPRLYLNRIPEELARRKRTVPENLPNNIEYVTIDPPSEQEVTDWLAAYPTLRKLGVPSLIGNPEPSIPNLGSGEGAIRLSWGGDETVPGLTQSEWTKAHVDVLHSDDFANVNGVVLPAVGGNEAAQHPLIAWWLTLYSLSMLARYYPPTWTAMLDVDKSQIAVPLDHLISVARSEVPELLEAVIRRLRDAPDRPGLTS